MDRNIIKWSTGLLVMSLLLPCLVVSVTPYGARSYDPILSDALMKTLMMRRYSDPPVADVSVEQMDQMQPVLTKDRFQTRVDDILLGREPNIRDQEYLEHSSLWGHQYVQGGAGEGYQRLKPDGSVRNVQVVKTDAVLPAYCNPPNPCPIGYTEEDGCIQDFSNSAAFSRDYQAGQECMCDREHMFDCPGTNDESELDTLAQSFSNNGLTEGAIERFAETFHQNSDSPNIAAGDSDSHRVVAKKFFTKDTTDFSKSSHAWRSKVKRDVEQVGTTSQKGKSFKVNPWMSGEKTPKVVAKKSPQLSSG